MRPGADASARILLVDDEPDILANLAQVLRKGGYDVETACGGAAALACFRRRCFDVLITDLRMPGLDGRDLLDLVKDVDPAVEVIILSGQATLDDAVETLREGRAFDLLQKPLTSTKQLILAIERALHRRLRALAVDGALPAPAGPRPFPLDTLTDRERELLNLLSLGLTNQEIARKACLGEKTVRNYLTVVFEKLGVPNRSVAMLAWRELSRKANGTSPQRNSGR